MDSHTIDDQNVGGSIEDQAYVKQTILDPAVKNLRLASVQDPSLLAWLDLLQLETAPLTLLGPSAFATIESGLPIVHIDMTFILNCFWISSMAGLVMMNPSGDVMYAVGEEYGQKVGESILAGEQPPPLKINLDGLALQPGQDVGAMSMGHQAFGAAIQWVILHEIGHHQLDHFDRDPQDLVESREWELAADNWAIQRMQHLGYSLDPLVAIMGAFLLEEEIRRMVGWIPPDELSTHPSWAQRLANLERFDTKKPSSFGNFISIIIVSSEPVTGEFFANELWIPRHPMPSVLCQFHQFGRTLQMPVEFASDGSIHIYGRTPQELNEIIVTNLDSLYPDVRFKFTDLNTGQVSTSETRGYQFDNGSLMSTSLKGLKEFIVRDVVQLDPNSYFKKFLLEVETRPEVISEAMKLQEQVTSGVNMAMLEYAKGIVDLQTADQMSQHIKTDISNRMSVLIGEEKFKVLQERMLASPLIAKALESLSYQ
jgi:hypothetical protein